MIKIAKSFLFTKIDPFHQIDMIVQHDKLMFKICDSTWCHFHIGYVRGAIMIIGKHFISKFIIENCEIRESLGKFADTVIYGNINVYCEWWCSIYKLTIN